VTNSPSAAISRRAGPALPPLAGTPAIDCNVAAKGRRQVGGFADVPSEQS
jgi:hypothetical protein